MNGVCKQRKWLDLRILPTGLVLKTLSWLLPVPLVQINGWSSTPAAPCWPSLMAVPLLQRWNWALLSPPAPRPPPLALWVVWRLRRPQSCWTPAWSWSSHLAAPSFAWSLWRRQRPVRRRSSTCVSWVLLQPRPTPPIWIECDHVSLTDCIPQACQCPSIEVCVCVCVCVTAPGTIAGLGLQK